MTTGNRSLFDALSPFDHPICRVVFPDGHDSRVIEAARHAGRIGLIEPVLLGSIDEVGRIAAQAGIDLEGVEVIDPQESNRFDEYALEFAEKRDIPLHTARAMSSVPFYFAAMMLSQGQAQAMIAGAGCSNQEMLMATDLAVGMLPEVQTATSFALLEVPGLCGPSGPLLMVADSLVNPEPTSQQLAEIALVTADLAEAILDWDPYVAMLAHSTHAHPLEPRAEHVARAVDIVRRRAPSLKVDGELQVDAALNFDVARRKLPHINLGEGRVAGRANVLVFPDLNSGDIALKMAQQLASATICGPILHGFEHPVGLISRAARPRDILGTIALTASYARARERLQPRRIHPFNVRVPMDGSDGSPGVFV
jgi:phosphate acetyltransferase